MEPSPSELAEKVNSLMKVGESVLTTLRAPVRLGLDHSAAYTVPSNGLLNLQGISVPRRLRRCLSLIR